MSRVTVETGGTVVKLCLGKETMRFHSIWLRDNAQDDETRDQINGQRLIALNQIPRETWVSDARVDADSLVITFKPENKVIRYDFEWLMENNYDEVKNLKRGWIPQDYETWDSDLKFVPSCDFDKLIKRNILTFNWLADVRKYGFGKITNGPITEGALFKVIELFGYVRETNYGCLLYTSPSPRD